MLFSIVLYLLQIDYTKERAICKINGMSNQQLLKKGSFKIIVPFTIFYIMIFTVMSLILKVVYSKLTFDLWMKMLLKTYSILYLVVLLLVLVIVWTSVNFNVKNALKKHTKVYEKVVFCYIFKFILIFSTIFLLTFSTLRIIEIKTDITNVNEYEKFDGYVGYQISNETDKINFIQNYDKEAVYFSSVVYSIDKDKEVYDKYCSNRFKDIMFCKSFLGSGKFFEIATGKDFEENTIVIPKVYQNNTEEILSDVSKLYPDFEYNVEYLDDTVIYSYMYDYHNTSKDFIKDAVWIVVINPSTELLNINTVYTKKQFDSGAYYKIESFKYDYMKYIELTRNVVSVLIITSIFIMIFYTLINYYIIKININNKIKKIAIQALNGQSIYDIFYINYSIIIVNAIIAGGFVVYLEKDSTYYIPIVFTILLVILDFITNRIIINTLMRKSIVGFLKGESL